MKNLTLTVEEDLARWARIAAAKCEQSLSRFVADLLQERMNREKGYDAAMRRSLSRSPVELKRGGSYPSRDELYDRSLFRR